MAQERLGNPQYLVHWKARIMTINRAVYDVIVDHAAGNGVSIIAAQAQPIGTNVNIEFYVKYRGKLERIRAKTQVIYCRILSANQGVVLELRFTFVSREDMHLYNNVLQVFASSKEFQLRSQ